eukprot:TRINITY_DN3515_c0_g1_i1.p2 TRINITY_DN3515_c0_g1~~TRINITY_DN3515_c0_g1_i1.p2  ORF type:complete len:256 (-),score=64.71 TRINITY_DN3515_c0_g1_i1:1180-1947(-)
MSQPQKKPAKTTQSATKVTQAPTKTTQSGSKVTKPVTKATQPTTKATQSATKKPTPAKQPATTAKPEEQLAKGIEQVKIEEKKVDEINIKLPQVATVIFDDNTGQIETTKKWPLVVDKNGNVETFMRYRDVNYLDTFNPSNMEPERIRMAILGAIRFGKELVVYTHNQLEAMWSIFSEKLNAIHPSLLLDIMTRKIIEDDYYKNLIREEDSNEYSLMEFNKSQMYELNKKFKLVLLTDNEDVDKFKADWLIITVN